MASFGPFAGLAAAAVGALCRHEAYALGLPEFASPPKPAQVGSSVGKQSSESQDASSQQDPNKRWDDERRLPSQTASGVKNSKGPMFALQFDGLDWFETIIR